ncbi:glycosyltransferase family 2 protein [Paenibacillus sp. sgz500958]|uniref:glycosyltransferase family 2 protein n=1 Tax=Paenibacillus sp. sgz500958 TaxID=3242475 RepID=UPI0036D3C2A7
MNKLISVIIVNYNGADYIEECIESVVAQTYTHWEIVILDNDSKDNSIELIQKYPFVHLIKAEENHGFAKGNNLAIEKAKGEYIALLNNDATAEPDWLETMARVLDDHPDFGSCGCRILSYYEQDLLDSAGLVLHASGMSRGRGRNERSELYASPEEILIPSGCAALYRRQALEETGLFDEDFFCYCEDTDLGLRLQIAGWKCMYVSQAVVYHRYSATAGKYSMFKTYLIERNHFWVVLKNFPPSIVFMNPVYTVSLYFYQVINMFRQQSATSELMSNTPKKELAFTLLRAHRDAWKSVFVMLGKRKRIYRTKKVTNKQIKGWMKQHHISLKSLFNS